MLVLSFLLIQLLIIVPPVQAAVTLARFSASAGEDRIFIDWETATEFDTAGFYVQRSLEESGSYQDVSPFFPAVGFGATGAEYQFVDTDVQVGTTYYYKLRVINNDQTEQLFGPVHATPGVPTPTLTNTVEPTNTSTPEFTVTSTPIFAPTRTPTRTPTRVPTGTPTPFQSQPTFPASTPSASPTFTPIPSPTSSPTYSGFSAPTLTPNLTSAASEPVVTLEPPQPQASATSRSDVPVQLESSSELTWEWSRIPLILVVGLLWVMLAIWLIYYLSQILH